jgi:dTDP-4-amino-4,6-dideoxygalactose transaminase
LSFIIPFNKPYLSGNETAYIQQAVGFGKLSGNGEFTRRCHRFFEEKYGFGKCLLTTSCTDALEMAALLLNIQEGDEVIIPAFSFVSTANAFVLRGARVVLVDSREDHPGMDESKVEELITSRTKVIVAVHYAGVACDMDVLMEIAKRHQLYIVEDSAQAIDSFYKGRPLGGIGHLAAFSFHETKNIQCGEGGMLVVNDPQFDERAEVIWEKGTNRTAFSRGEVKLYQWIDVGSSFLPSEITAAFLFAQLENLDSIQQRRKEIWKKYLHEFSPFLKSWTTDLPSNSHHKSEIYTVVTDAIPDGSKVRIGIIPSYATNNGHMFYLVFEEKSVRTAYIQKLEEQGILAIFHYVPLHQSPYYKNNHKGRTLPFAEHYGDCLVRLPLYYELGVKERV